MAEPTPQDELEIRQLVARFADVCVIDDRERFRTLWAPEGVWEISAPYPGRAEGIAAVMELWDQLRPPFEVFLQMAHSGVVELAPDGQRARARWVMQEVGRGPGRNYNNFGLYLDELVRLEGTWKFARRAYHYLWLDDQSSIPGRHFPVTEPVKRFL